MMSLPWRSSSRARFRTSNAVSVPSRAMRLANRSSNWTACDIEQNGLLYYRKQEVNYERYRRGWLILIDVSLIQVLKNPCCSHTAADTHGHQPILRIAPPHFPN